MLALGEILRPLREPGKAEHRRADIHDVPLQLVELSREPEQKVVEHRY
jgi:hypothetical protein